MALRGHSTTTWTESCHFWPLPPAWTVFITLSMDKTDIFWPPPPLFCPRSYWMTPYINLFDFKKSIWINITPLLVLKFLTEAVPEKKNPKVNTVKLQSLTCMHYKSGNHDFFLQDHNKNTSNFHFIVCKTKIVLLIETCYYLRL